MVLGGVPYIVTDTWGQSTGINTGTYLQPLRLRASSAMTCRILLGLAAIVCILQLLALPSADCHIRRQCKRYAAAIGSVRTLTLRAQSEVDGSGEMDALMDHIEGTMLPRLFAGIDTFRPGQREVIRNVLEAKSSLAVLPTGAGKSLCYMLPSQLLDGLTIVVSPLLAMMRDQVSILKAQGIAAGRLDSTMDIDDILTTKRDVRSGRLKILYVSPERFNNEGFRNTMKSVKVAMFVVDEAHCISEWGHAFRPDYLRLAQFATISKAQVKLAVTATATQRVALDIVERLGIDQANVVRLPSVRKNLILQVSKFNLQRDSYSNRVGAVIGVLNSDESNGSSIIYVSRQKLADTLAADLVAAGYNARSYHAGLKSEEREQIENWFLGPSQKGSSGRSSSGESGSKRIVVGTIAFGMGVDCNNVRSVVHFDLPRSIEDYVQGIGRGGRDERPARCLAILAESDVPALRSQIQGATPQKHVLNKVVTLIFSKETGYPSVAEKNCVYMNYYDISHECDIGELQLKLAMSHLVQNAIVTELTPVYGNYRVSVLDRARLGTLAEEVDGKAARELLSGWVGSALGQSRLGDDGEEEEDVSADGWLRGDIRVSDERAALAALVAVHLLDEGAKHSRKKFTEIDVVAFANAHSALPRDVVSAINALVNLGICSNGGLTRIYSRYNVLKAVDMNDVVDMLHKHALENERRALVRVDEVVSLLSKGSDDKEKIWDYVAEYLNGDGFAESVASEFNGEIFDEEAWATVADMVRKKVIPGDDPFLVARFATGVSSPRIVRSKLSRMSDFGVAMSSDWRQVIKRSVELVDEIENI